MHKRPIHTFYKPFRICSHLNFETVAQKPLFIRDVSSYKISKLLNLKTIRKQIIGLQLFPFKLSTSFGYLYFSAPEQVEYFHPSINNFLVDKTPSLLRSKKSLRKYCDRVGDIDLIGATHLENYRFSKIDITNIIFYISKIRPDYVAHIL